MTPARKSKRKRAKVRRIERDKKPLLEVYRQRMTASMHMSGCGHMVRSEDCLKCLQAALVFVLVELDRRLLKTPKRKRRVRK